MRSLIIYKCALILLLFTHLSIRDTYAQNVKLIDSLKKILPLQPLEKQVDILSIIGFEYRNSLQDSTFVYCNRALNLGKKIKIKSGLAKPLNFIGLAYTNKGNYKKALDFYYQSIEVSSQQNDSIQLAHSYNNLGRAFYDMGDFTRAYENFIHSKVIFERINDKGGLAYVYRSLANVYKSQKNNSEALEMSTRALELRKQLRDNRTLASAYMELGLLYKSMDNYPLSLQKLKMADSIASHVNDKLTKAEIKLGIAENLFQSQKVDSAFQIATSVLALLQNGNNYKLFLRSSMLLARYHLLKKNYNKALAILNDIESDSSGFGLASFQRDAAFLLMDYYSHTKNKAAVEKYTNRYHFLNAKLENTDLKRQVDQLKFSVELEKTEKENRLLKVSQEQNTMVISKQRNENVFLLILAILISVFAFVFWLFSRKRKRDNFKLEIQNQEINRQREEIDKQNAELSKANSKLSELNHEKNMLISIVAHDLKSPINRIYALSRLLEMEGGLTEVQQNYVQLIKETTNSGLDLITGLLDVSALEESKLKPTIEKVDLASLFNTKIEILKATASAKMISIGVTNNLNQEITIDSDYFGRILDNLVNNAIKFSTANKAITISLYVEFDWLILSIKDEGPGFSDYDKKNLFQKFKKLSARPTAGESSNGLGLAIVKTLVDRLNGQIELMSEQGRGSEFIVRFPII